MASILAWLSLSSRSISALDSSSRLAISSAALRSSSSRCFSRCLSRSCSTSLNLRAAASRLAASLKISSESSASLAPSSALPPPLGPVSDAASFSLPPSSLTLLGFSRCVESLMFSDSVVSTSS